MNKIALAFTLVFSTSLVAHAATVSLTPAPGLSHVWVKDNSAVLNFTQVGVGGEWLNFGNDPIPNTLYSRDFYTDANTVYLVDDDLYGIDVRFSLAPDVYVLLDYFHGSENLVQYEWSHIGFNEVATGFGWSAVETQGVPEPGVTALLLLALLCVTGLSSKKRSQKRRERETGFGV